MVGSNSHSISRRIVYDRATRAFFLKRGSMDNQHGDSQVSSQESPDRARQNRMVTICAACGWICLICSSSCMYILSSESDPSMIVGGDKHMLVLIVARLFGISAFICGVVCLLHERWTSGALLLFFSMLLPIISIFVAGSI